MAQDVGELLAAELKSRGWRFAAAESVTAGLVTSRAAQAPEASVWLLGGVIAYSSQVKERQLGVEPGPVINPDTAAQMARGVADLLQAEVAVATTGVGGPDPEEDQPAGTVWVGVYVDGRVSTHHLEISGNPADVCQGAVEQALQLVVDALRR
ncbi:MAG: CinA family protein [Actinobacteria bacterium]|nr:CinA family protein [Actinomycetota bacterium]MBW3647252.1 CinA family protein [Actinomycetota bacterium]